MGLCHEVYYYMVDWVNGIVSGGISLYGGLDWCIVLEGISSLGSYCPSARKLVSHPFCISTHVVGSICLASACEIYSEYGLVCVAAQPQIGAPTHINLLCTRNKPPPPLHPFPAHTRFTSPQMGPVDTGEREHADITC